MIEKFIPAFTGTALDEVVLLVAGLLLLVKGADYFVTSSATIARRFGISELVIGLTLVAIGTSLPELVAAIIASLKNESALVMGNIVGANIANFTLLVGSAALIRTIQIDRSMLERDGYMALWAALLMGAFALNGKITMIEGVVFLVIFFAYTAFLVQTSQQYEKAYHIRQFSRYFFSLGFVTGPIRSFTGSFRNHLSTIEESQAAAQTFPWRSLVMLVISIGMIAMGGNLLVEQAVFFADYLGLPVTLVGVIMALGTTAPEFSVSIAAARQGMSAMIIGNAVGSVITNTFLILGVASLITPIVVSYLALRYAIPVLIVTVMLLLVFKKTNMQISRTEGAILCCVYLAFIAGYGYLATAFPQ